MEKFVRVFIVLLTTLSIATAEVNFWKEIVSPEENQEEKVDLFEAAGFKIEDDTWMNRYFLVPRINLLPILKAHASDIGITLEQIEEIRSFYEEFHPEMVKKAKEVEKLEKELKELVLGEGNPKRIKELVINIAKLKAELTVYDIKLVKVIKDALTEEQFKKLLTYYEKSII